MARCVPGRGTSAAYRATSSAYYRAVMAAQQRRAMAQAALLAREKGLLKQATTTSLLLDAAERAYKEGDIRMASRVFVNIALKYRGHPIAARARQRLAQLAAEARQKLKGTDAKLAREESVLSPGESSQPLTPQQLAARWEKTVVEAFQEYDQIADDYGGVPEVKRELKPHVAKQRRRPEFAAVLQEPEAKMLWEEAQRHEREDQLCCAYWVYKEAAGLAPARSGGLARRRFAEMDQDARIVAAAEACRELQECHKIYNRAERLRKAGGDKAKELFAQIVARAPAGTEIHRAALSHLQEMK